MNEATRGHLAMLAFSGLVAGSFSLGSIVANDIAPQALNAARFWIAAVVIGAVVFLTNRFDPKHYRAPWRFVVLGGLFATYFVLMFEGLKTASAVSAAAVFTLTPVLSAVAGYVLLRQITTPRMALALAIGAAGAMWVIFRADMSALLAFRIGTGEAIYFFGCIAHAIYTPMVRRLNNGEPAVAFTFGTLVAGAVLLTIVGWPDLVATPWADLAPIVWIALAYVAICASSVTFLLLQFATLRLPSAKVMAYTYLTPSWVLLWEIALGRDRSGGWILAGVALTIVALVLLLKDDGS